MSAEASGSQEDGFQSEDKDAQHSTAFDQLSPCRQRRANAPITVLSNHHPRHARASISHRRPSFPPHPHICPRRTQNLIACSSVSLSSPLLLVSGTSPLLPERLFSHPPRPDASNAGPNLYRHPHPLPLRCSCHLPRGHPGAPPDRFQTLGHRGTTIHSLWLRLCVGGAQRVWRGLLGMSSSIASATHCPITRFPPPSPLCFPIQNKPGKSLNARSQ